MPAWCRKTHFLGYHLYPLYHQVSQQCQPKSQKSSYMLVISSFLPEKKRALVYLPDGAYVYLYYYSDAFPSLQGVVLCCNTCNRKILISQTELYNT